MGYIKVKAWVKLKDSQEIIEEEIEAWVADETRADKNDVIESEVSDWKNNLIDWGYSVIDKQKP